MIDIQPTRDLVLVEVAESAAKTSGGIYIPDSREDWPQRLVRATVIATGPGKVSAKGVLIEPRVRKGDVVLYPAFQGTCVVNDSKTQRKPIEAQGGDRVLVEECHIVGVVEQ